MILNMKVTPTPIRVGAFGTVPKNLEYRQVIDGGRLLLKSARIL